MTENMFADPGAANKVEPPRDWLGRYRLPHPGDENGKQYGFQRVTTFAKVLEDTFHLDLWKQRMVSIGLSKRPDLYALLATVTDPESSDGKKTLNDICEKAMEAAGTSVKSNLGTALHSYAEQLLAGLPGDQIPQQFHGDLMAYRNELARLQITELPYYTERVVFNGHFKVSGKFDRIVKLPDGSLCIADLKTRDGDLDLSWPSIATQLATYANSTHIRNYETSRWEDMPNVRKDIALVFHLPVGKAECHVYQVNIAAGWWSARIAAEAQQWRKTKQLAAPYLPGYVAPAIEKPLPGQVEQGAQPAPTVPALAAVPGATDPFATDSAMQVTLTPTNTPPAEVQQLAHGGQQALAAAQALPPTGVQPTPDWQPTAAEVQQATPAAGHPAWSSAQQQVIQLAPDGTQLQPNTAAAPPATRSPKAPINPATASEEELATLQKAELQNLLRSLDPNANVARQRKNLAAEIVRLRPGGSGPEVLSAVVSNAPGPVPPDPTPGYPKPDNSLAATQAAMSRRAEANGETFTPPITITGQTGVVGENLGPEIAGNPFGAPAAVEQAPRNEAFYLQAIAAAQSRGELAKIYDDAIANKVPWTENLNRSGIARNQAFQA